MASRVHAVDLISSSNAEVTCDVGDIVELHLAENPSTGYRWHVQSAPAGFPLVDNSLTADAAVRGLVGAPGRLTLVFAADCPVEGTVVLALARPWEKTVEPLRRICVDITVG